MQKTKYTPKYFIKKFEQIPEEKWCKGSLSSEKGAHCALGHAGMRGLNDASLTPEADALSGLIGKMANCHHEFMGVTEINDLSAGATGSSHQIPGTTPKERILNALYIRLRSGLSIK